MSLKYNKYTCECGKIFTNPQAFNGHKSHCKLHNQLKYGSTDVLENYEQQRRQSLSKTTRTKYEKLKRQDLDKWLSEQHKCETCGKVMTEYYGSGRFCSQACANTRKHSNETKEKLRRASTGRPNNLTYITKYELNPKFCKFCGKKLSYEARYRTYCSKDCFRESMSIYHTDKFKTEGLSYLIYKHNYKYGTYKGISCDSSYELAFVLYHLDHGISLTRNKTDSFEYLYKGKIRNFFPDFIIDDTYVELKSWHSEEAECKSACMPKNIKFKILYKEDMYIYLNYAKEHYGKDFCKLYDRNFPSWLDKLDT